jgi:DNA-binding HxlR family transcriptional regulator
LKISKILTVPSVKILLFMLNKEKARYTDLVNLIVSRGVLSSNLKALEKEDILTRTVINSKPIQTYYTLSIRGRKVATCLNDLKSCILEDNSSN